MSRKAGLRTVLLFVVSTTACGCIEYHIESPERSLVLSRGIGRETVKIVFPGPLMRVPYRWHRQYSLIGVPFLPFPGLFFLSQNAFRNMVDKFRGDPDVPMENVAIVTGIYFLDQQAGGSFPALLHVYGIAKSFVVGVYQHGG